MLRYSTSTPAVIVIRIVLKLSKEDNRRGWKKMKENRRKYKKLEEDGKEWKGMHAQLRAPFRVRLCPLFNLIPSEARGGGHNMNVTQCHRKQRMHVN